jgi:Family of unknown function (DUF5335)
MRFAVMATRRVSPVDWPSFFDGFNHRHTGWLVRLETLAPSIGAQVQAEDVPLRAITVDHDHGAPTIEIMVGDRARGTITHVIDEVGNVWLKTAEDGSEEALEVEARGGVTLLTFRVTVQSEMINDAMGA